jgi:hypothetical protein
LWKGGKVAIHYHGLDRKNAVFEKGAGRAIRQTLGLRVWKNEGAWDFNYEGFAQWGSFRGIPIRAWALSQDTGYTLGVGRFRPRFGLRSDIASGDHGPSDRALRFFDPLFPAAPVYSGPSGLLGPKNLIDITPTIRIPLRRNLSLALESSSFWRESLGDGIYSPFIAPIRLSDSNPKR